MLKRFLILASLFILLVLYMVNSVTPKALCIDTLEGYHDKYIDLSKAEIISCRGGVHLRKEPRSVVVKSGCKLTSLGWSTLEKNNYKIKEYCILSEVGIIISLTVEGDIIKIDKKYYKKLVV